MTVGLPFVSALLHASSDGGGSGEGSGGATDYVNSIQYFEITIPNGSSAATATIDSVDVGRAFIVGITCEAVEDLLGVDEALCAVTLTNATTITANRWRDSWSVIVRGYIIEGTEELVESVQYANVEWLSNNATTLTSTISGVNTSHSIIIDLGSAYEYTSDVDLPGRAKGYWTFNSATEIEMNRAIGYSSQDGVARCCVVEFNPAAIESIQEVTFNGDAGPGLYLQASIAAVGLAQTVLFSGGATTTVNNDSRGRNGFELVNATTARCYVGADVDQVSSATLWVVEFASGVVSYAEQGNISLGTTTSDGWSLGQTVDVATSTVIPLGVTIGAGPYNDIKEASIGLELTDGNTVTATNHSSEDSQDVSYFQVVEWSM